jgi:hypothetical protein
MAFSKGEMAQVRASLSPGSMPPVLQLKSAIAKIFFECVENHAGPGEQTRMYMLRYDDTNKFYIVSDRLRHDRDTGSIFLDGFFVPDTADFDRLMTVRNKIKKCCVMPASKEGMELWQRPMPALAERCRSWEHTSDCKYKSGCIKSSVCDCGLGQNAEHMPSGFESVAKFAIRIALPFISAVPYVESVVDDKLAAKISVYKATIGQEKQKEASASASANAVCDNCGSDKPGLKACTRCEKVKYCNHTC